MQALDPLDALSDCGASVIRSPIRRCRTGEKGNLDLNAVHKSLLNPCWGNVAQQSVRARGARLRATSVDYSGDVCIISLTGKSLKIHLPSFRCTVFELKKMIQDLKGFPLDQQRLVVNGEKMENQRSLSFYKVRPGSNIYLILRLKGVSLGWSLDASALSPKFNYDFTQIVDRIAYERGGMVYIRPCGWFRYALNVETRYGNKIWLEGSQKRRSRHQSATGEWPVSYHGTSQHNGLSIAQHGFKLSQGVRFQFGRGIYTSPDPNIAQKFAQKYVYNNRAYYMILQNRVNPATLIKITNEQTRNQGEFWLVPDDADIRPYGFCLKEVREERRTPQYQYEYQQTESRIPHQLVSRGLQPSLARATRGKMYAFSRYCCCVIS